LEKKGLYSAILQNLRGLRGFLTGSRQEKFLTAKDAKGAKGQSVFGSWYLVFVLVLPAFPLRPSRPLRWKFAAG